MSKVLVIVRGRPGSGKSFVAKKLAPQWCIFEADQFFCDKDEHGNPIEDSYAFDAKKIGMAHKDCQERVRHAMHRCVGDTTLVVSNTFTQKWEAKPYIDLAKRYGYEVQLITVQSNFQNVHNVPQESIERMKKRWENFSLEDFE